MLSMDMKKHAHLASRKNARQFLDANQDALRGQERFTAKGFIELVEAELCRKYELSSVSINDTMKNYLQTIPVQLGVKTLHLEQWFEAYYESTGSSKIQLN
ncbi:hypothetical protein N9R79_03800 [Vibrio sp.]|nr:hypothetical protein [Vibrio sp.]